MTVRALPHLRFKDPETQRAYDAIREALQEGNGERGDPDNRWLTVGEAGTVVRQLLISGGGTPPPGGTDPDGTDPGGGGGDGVPPPPPTSLTATNGTSRITLAWENPSIPDLLETEIWGKRVIPDWSAETTYANGSRAIVTGVVYQSIKKDNLNHAVTDPAWWLATTIAVMTDRVKLGASGASPWIFSQYAGANLGQEDWVFWVRNADIEGLFSSYYPADEVGVPGSSVTVEHEIANTDLWLDLETNIVGLDEAVADLETLYGDTVSAAQSAAEAATAMSEAIQAKAEALGASAEAVQAKADAIIAQGGAVTAKNSAQIAATSAETAKSSAQTFANSASTSATNAAGSASTASQSAGVATTAKDAAAGSASAAATSASNAASYATDSETAATASTAAKVAAETAKSSAQTYATNAATSATSAAGSASTASQSAGVATTAKDNAAGSASAAATSASSAASYATSAENASTAATSSKLAAEASKNSAATSASAAATSATNASASATAASQSATASNTAKLAAETAKSAAETARTEAVQAKNDASGSASSAATSATTAANSATTAGNSATAAAGSATLASTKATEAGTASQAAQTARVAAESARDGAAGSASAAATSASTAQTNATNAGTSATSASQSATNASTSASNALTYRNQASTSATTAQGYATASAQDYSGITARLDNAGGTGVSVEQKFTAQADDLTGLRAQWSVKIDSNGHVSGFGLSSEPANGTGPSTSYFIVRADRFAIGRPGYGIYDIPFSVDTSSGIVRLNEAHISKIIRSTNYNGPDSPTSGSYGSNGWLINQDGTAVFNTVIVRSGENVSANALSRTLVYDPQTIYNTTNDKDTVPVDPNLWWRDKYLDGSDYAIQIRSPSTSWYVYGEEVFWCPVINTLPFARGRTTNVVVTVQFESPSNGTYGVCDGVWCQLYATYNGSGGFINGSGTYTGGTLVPVELYARKSNTGYLDIRSHFFCGSGIYRLPVGLGESVSKYTFFVFRIRVRHNGPTQDRPYRNPRIFIEATVE